MRDTDMSSDVVGARVELELGDYFDDVYMLPGDIAVLTDDGQSVFVNALQFDGFEQSHVRIRMSVGDKLPASPQLYRWVATMGDDLVIGGLTAQLSDDGYVSIQYRHDILATDIEGEDLHLVIQMMAQLCTDMAKDARRLFG